MQLCVPARRAALTRPAPARRAPPNHHPMYMHVLRKLIYYIARSDADRMHVIEIEISWTADLSRWIEMHLRRGMISRQVARERSWGRAV